MSDEQDLDFVSAWLKAKADDKALNQDIIKALAAHGSASNESALLDAITRLADKKEQADVSDQKN